MSRSGRGMRVTVLGSGTLLPDDRRRSASHLVEVGDARVLLDCGSGTLHGMDRHGVPWRDLSHVVLSHFHADHVGDLVPLLFALRHGVTDPRRRPLWILGPAGTGSFLEGLREIHGTFVTDPGFEVGIRELSGSETWAAPGGDFELSAHPTPHTAESLAYRIDATEGGVGYTGDTGPDNEVAGFLAGLRLLVAECSLSDPPAIDTHLSPRTLAAMARVADPELLVTTHVYPPLLPEEVPRLVKAAGWGGWAVAGRDGLVVEIPDGPVVMRS